MRIRINTNLNDKSQINIVVTKTKISELTKEETRAILNALPPDEAVSKKEFLEKLEQRGDINVQATYESLESMPIEIISMMAEHTPKETLILEYSL